MSCVALDHNYIILRRQIVHLQKRKEYTGKSGTNLYKVHPLKTRILFFLGPYLFMIMFF